MISLISPAKTLDFEPFETNAISQPLFKEESGQLARSLSRKSMKGLEKMMSISKDLARLNSQRYKTFSVDPDPSLTKQAIFAFKGDVYRGMQPENFNSKEIEFSQNHVRILSGMYGILKPLDLIQPYRLEMGTRLKIGRKKNLYSFWSEKITKSLNSEIQQTGVKALVNLASQEYFAALDTDQIKIPIINIHFRENRTGELKFVSFNAKKARGMMIRYIVASQLNDIDSIKGFDLEEYCFSQSHSDEKNFTFIR